LSDICEDDQQLEIIFGLHNNMLSSLTSGFCLSQSRLSSGWEMVLQRIRKEQA